MVVCADDAVARTGPAPAQPGHGAALRERDRRLQHADDRPARRDRPGAAAPAAGVDRRSAGATPRSSARRWPRRRRTSGLVLPQVAPAAEPVWHQYTVRSPRPRPAGGEAGRARRAHRRLLPDADPPAAGLRARPRPAAHRPRPRPRCCPSRCTRRCPTRQLEHVVGGGHAQAVRRMTARHLRAGLIGLGHDGPPPRPRAAAAARCRAGRRRRHPRPDPRGRPGRRGPRHASTSSSTAASTCAWWPPPRGPTRRSGCELAEAGVADADREAAGARRQGGADASSRRSSATASLGCVGHIERFNPALQDMRRRLAAGELGDLYQVVTRRQGPVPGPHRRRRRHPRPGHPRHRPHRVGDRRRLPVGVRAHGAPQRAPARGPGERGRRAVQRAGRHAPGQLAVAVQGAGHHRDRGAAAASSPTRSPRT